MKPIKKIALSFCFTALIMASFCVLADQKIKIGVIGSYSGPFSDYGRQFDNGINLFLKQNDGTIAGHPVEIIRRDTSGPSPDKARRFAQELVVRNDVDFIVGLDFSPNAFAVAPVVTEAKVPTIIMNASASGLTEESPYMVRVAFTVAQVSSPMAEWALQNDINKVMTIVSDYGPGLDAEAAFVRAFEEGGGEIVTSLRVPLSNPDFSAYILKIRSENPESVFFFFPSGPQPTAFMKAVRDANLNEDIKFIATGEATDDTYLPDSGGQMLGLITSHHYSWSSETAQPYVTAYADAFGDQQRAGYFSVAAYDGMTAISNAVEATEGDLAPSKIMSQLYGMEIDSPRGPIRISENNGDIIQNVYIRRTEMLNGEPVSTQFQTFEDVEDPGGYDQT